MASQDLEVIFVQSKIRPGAPLTPAVFKQWYEESHIPDLLQTPGITTVLRYAVAADSYPDCTADFPYLAVYPRVDRGWLHSSECEFVKVPLHNSEILPGPRHFIFDVADFVMGAYEHVGQVEEGRFGVGPPKHLIVVPIDTASVEGHNPEEVLRTSLSGVSVSARSTLLKYDFSPAGQQPRHAEITAGRVFVGGGYVAFHQLDRVPEGFACAPGVVVYNLLGAFGDVTGKV